VYDRILAIFTGEPCMESITKQATELLPIASNQLFDVRLSSADNHILLYRQDTGNCIVERELSSEEITQIREASRQ
jgi:hypothetical protein